MRSTECVHFVIGMQTGEIICIKNIEEIFLLPGVIFPRGFAPNIARFTFALRPSIIGFGSLHARSALARLPIITYLDFTYNLYIIH